MTGLDDSSMLSVDAGPGPVIGRRPDVVFGGRDRGTMSGTTKAVLMIGGILAAVLIAAQLVMGQLILGGRADLVKAHQHSGYTAVVVSLLYITFSLITIASVPTRPKP